MRKSGSGSSILKPQKPRQPLQVVNFDSSSDEGNPPTKIKRRVSFAEKKHVKEFCHSTEQGTVWDSTYEEHDCSSKGSFQNTRDESNKKVTECISKPEEDMCIVVENNLNCSNNSSLANDEPSELAMRMNEEDNNVTDMDCTSPVACTKHSDNRSLIENIPPSDIFLTSNNSPSSDIVAYNVTDEESPEIHTSPPNVHVTLDVYFELSICKLDKTCLQDASMELTRAIPAPITDTLMLHPHTEEQDIIQNNDEVHLNDLHTNCTTNLNNVSMEITQAAPTHTQLFTRCDSNILTHIPTKIQTCESATCNARNNVHADTILRAESPTIYTNDSMVLTTVIPTSANLSCTNNIPMDLTTGGAISADDRTTFFHNVSMEITKAILPRNQEGRASPIVCESVREENIQRREVTSDSICLTKGTRFLHESMELTETVPSPLYNERTRDAARDASLVSDTIQDSRSLAKNIGRSQIDSINRSDCILSDELIQDASHHSTEDVAPNKLENLIVPENKCLSTRDTILSTRSPLSSTVRSTCPSADLATSTCQINAIANQTIQDVSMEITAALPLTSHRAQDVTLNKVEDDESQHSPTKNPVTQENLTVSTLQTRITHNKSNISIDSSDNSDHFDKITKLYKKNDRDSLIFQPLQENDVYEAPGADDNCAHERFVDTTDRTKTNLGDSLNGSNECSFLRKSLPYLENNCDLQSIDPPSLVQSEEETSLHDAPGDDRLQISTIDDRANRHVSSAQLVTNKTTESERPTESTKTVAKDNESSTLLRDRSQSINIENSRTKYRHERNIEESNTENKKVSVQTIERTNLIDSQSSELTLDTTDVQDLDKRIFVSPINVTRDKVTKEVQLEQSMEHTRDHIEENIVREKSVVIPIKEKSLTEEDHFFSLSQKLVTHSERDDIIWNVYHKNVDRKMIVFGFMANSLLIATFLFGDLNCLEDNPRIRVKILSRLTDKADMLIRIVHKLLLRKVNAEMLEHHEDIFSMLDFMSQEVKLAMNFMFDLRRLSDLNLMEITYDKISFVVLSKNMNIILKITIEVKVFDELTPNDINVHYILGAVSETEVKNLIKNVKKNCQFLRRYINDVKNYVDIMEDC